MPAEAEIKLIVGLGNPGAEYEKTRHNAGFWFADAVMQKFGNASWTEDSKFKGSSASVMIGSKNVRLLKPNTFMNLSGQSVAALANFYKIEIENILLAHDELDIDPGTARLKSGGGHGGHNGLRDIISCMGNQKNFARLRIGIGHPGKASQVSSFVLKKASSNEQSYIDEAIQECVKHIEAIVRGDWQSAMNTLHRFNANPEAKAKAEALRLAKEKKKLERAAQRQAQRDAVPDKNEDESNTNEEQ